MIIYETSEWAWRLIISLEGSVVPKTLHVSCPAALVAALIQLSFSHFRDVPLDLSDASRTDQFLGSFTAVLGFLIIFRTRIAYSRFWEAASFLQTIRGGWFNVVSSCCAFCSEEETKLPDVFQFQHTLVRLVSLLYASALHEVAVMKDNSFEVLDFDGFDKEQFDYMQSNSKKTEILMQWVQRLIMDGHRRGTLDAPAPILSRVFQELANGVLDLANAKRICRYPFPFPYAQIQALLLILHWGISVWIAGTTLTHPVKASILAFVSTFCLWSMHYTSLEIEQPYGDDANDLPLSSMQSSMNDSLVVLLNPLSQMVAKVDNHDGDEILCKLWRASRDPNARMKKQLVGKNKTGQRRYKTTTFSAAQDMFRGHSVVSSNASSGRNSRRVSFDGQRTDGESEDLSISYEAESKINEKDCHSPTGRPSIVSRRISVKSIDSMKVARRSFISDDVHGLRAMAGDSPSSHRAVTGGAAVSFTPPESKTNQSEYRHENQRPSPSSDGNTGFHYSSESQSRNIIDLVKPSVLKPQKPDADPEEVVEI